MNKALSAFKYFKTGAGAEIYFPIGPAEFNINDKAYRTDEYVRPFVFMDYAALYPDDGTDFHDNLLISAGAGLRIQLPYDIAVKVAYSIPLRHNHFEPHHGSDLRLELSFSPDFNQFFSK